MAEFVKTGELTFLDLMIGGDPTSSVNTLLHWVLVMGIGSIAFRPIVSAVSNFIGDTFTDKDGAKRNEKEKVRRINTSRRGGRTRDGSTLPPMRPAVSSQAAAMGAMPVAA